MSPCSWPISYAGVSNNLVCSTLESMPASGKEEFEKMAVDYLWRWSGQRFGECEVTIRPCGVNCGSGSTYFGGGSVNSGSGFATNLLSPVIIDGSWYNIGCGNCLDNCSCDGGMKSIKIPGPIIEINEIVIDGEILDPEAYRVDNFQYLVREDGGRWPICQDLSKPDGEENTWSISYTRGSAVPVGGQIAAGVLACELAKAAAGDPSCQLPKRVQSINRQGVSMFFDNFEDLNDGRTGIWLIDSWLTSIRKAPQRSVVYSTDLRRARRTTSN